MGKGTRKEAQTLISDFGTASIKTAGSLILILGLIVFLFYLLKKFRLNTFPMGKHPLMRLLGTLSLAPKRSLALVEICGQWFVVGVGTENISLISKVDAPTEQDRSEAVSGAGSRGFHALLKKKAFGAFGVKERDERP